MRHSAIPRLLSVQLELTIRCNERCVHCYISHADKTTDMDRTLLFNILEQCRDMGVEDITFSGGEPMLHPTFLEAVEKANWYGFRIRVFSNLTRLDDTIVQQLKSWNVHEVQASLYSVDPEIHDAITGLSGSCELTKQGLKKLADHSVPVFISCPIMKQNKDSYSGVLAFAESLKIKSAPDNMIFGQTDGTGGNLANRLSTDEALQVIQNILDNDSAYDDERFLPDYDNPDTALPCVQDIGKYGICVDVKGNVTPSPGWNYVLGNLHTQPLKDIWETSPALEKIRAISLDDFPQCRNCPDIQFCGMSLEGNANENPQGNPFVIPEHVCLLARRTRELVHAWHNARRDS